MVHTAKHRGVKRKTTRVKRTNTSKGKAKGRGRLVKSRKLAKTSVVKTTTSRQTALAKTRARVRNLGITNRNPLE